MIKGRVDLKLDKLKYARGSMNNVAIRKAINKAAVPVKAAVVAAVPRAAGHLAKSIRIKSKYYAKAKVWAAIVGPSSSFSRVRRKPKRVKPPKRKKANKTLQGLKKKAAGVKKQLSKGAGKFASRVVKAVAGKRGAKFLKQITPKPKPKTPKPKPKKIVRRKRPWKGGKVRPARYAHLTQWGSSKITARHWLERALSRSKGQFSRLLQSALKTEIAALLNR